MPSGTRVSSRVEAIDGLRGLLLILMTTTHLTFTGGLFLKHFHPDVYSLVDGAFGFVFVSGLMVGLSYGRVMLRKGVAAGSRKLWGRALELYAYAGGLLLALTASTLIVPGFAVACADWLGPLAAPDLRLLAAELLLLQQADYADILTPYVVYLAISPLALAACLAGRWRLVAAASVGLWLAAQLGAGVPLAAGLDSLLGGLRDDLHVPTEFNIMAWQLLFCAGLVLGAQWVQGRLDLGAWLPRRPPRLFWAALAVIVGCAALVVGSYHAPKGWAEPLTWLVEAQGDKPRLGWLGVLNLAAIAYVLTWLVVAAPRARSPVMQGVGRAASTVLNLSFLRLIGRHSLHVYVWHVALVYGARLLDIEVGPFGEVTKVGLAVAVYGLLAAPAVVRERRASGGRRKSEGGNPLPLVWLASGGDRMKTRAEGFKALIGKPHIGPEDVLALRAALFSDMWVSAEEAEALFAINDLAASTCPQWRELFIEAITDYVVRQQDPAGYVDAAKAEWLVSRIAADGRLKSQTELELLIYVLEQATDAPAMLCEVAVNEVAAVALNEERRSGDGPTLTSEEVERLRRVLYAFAGEGGGAAVSRGEAEVLFALNDAARGRPNSPAWRELFVHAIGGALLADAGYEPPARDEARRREAWLSGPTEGVGGLLGKSFATLLTDPLAGFRRTSDVFAERNVREDLEAAAAAQLEQDEVAWLSAQIGRDGQFDDNEIALLRFVQREASTVHPSLDPLLRACAAVETSDFGSRGAQAAR